MKVRFTHPLSNTAKFEGELHVEATVDGNEVEIDRVIFSDKHGRKADVTYLIVEWGNINEMLEDMAVNNAVNLGHPELEDVTMMEQDNY